MSPDEKFKEMATASKSAIEDFNDFADDRAIAWAADEIKRLSLILKKHFCDRCNPIPDDCHTPAKCGYVGGDED